MSQPNPQPNLEAPEAERATATPPGLVDPASYWKYGAGFLLLSALLVAGLLYYLQPVECLTGPKRPCLGLARLAALCALAAASGATVHAMTSFAVFAGKGLLAYSWLWWVYLRIPIGTLLGLLVYFAMISGLFGTLALDEAQSVFTTVLASGLAGLFSKQVTQKLSDVLNFLFGLRQGASASDDGDRRRRPESTPGVVADDAGAPPPPALQPPRPPGPDRTVQTVQERLIALGFMPALRANGKRLDDGELGPVTRAAIEAFLVDQELDEAERRATLGEESEADYWVHLATLLEDAIEEGQRSTSGEKG